MSMDDGRYVGDSKDSIMAAMIADAKEYWGEDLNDAQVNVLREFYEPIAERFAETQEDVGLVLDSAQIDYASDEALELLTALVGIVRTPARKASGDVTFSRSSAASTDYTIPKGTVVQTDSAEPVVFETTATATLSTGSTSVTVNAEAQLAGATTNVGANTITVIRADLPGVESVTNPAQMSGGADREGDEELRARAKDELGAGSRASARALINAAKAVDGVTSVSIFINNGNLSQIDNGGGDGFELVVAGGNTDEVARAIRDTMSGGDTSWGGYNGTKVTVSDVDLGNGQTVPVDFSRPTEVQIYVDMELNTTTEYAGDEAVQNAIVDYIGGLRTTGNEVTGLGVGDDVIYTELMARIQMVDGVHDVPTLEVGTSASPTGTANVAISASEVATADGTDGSLTITEL